MRNQTPNSQYNVAQPGSWAVRLAEYQRRRMYRRFREETGIGETDSVLDVGVTSDRSYAASNYLEAWHPQKHNVTAMGIDDASFLEDLYPGMKFVHGNGLNIPFGDRHFDVVHSSAVLEHVGSADNQRRFVSECARVAGRAFFLTTPNRWFPVEFHTVLPLVHWLPKRLFRRLLRSIDMEFFAEESNLNLVGSRELRALAQGLDGFETKVCSVRLGGWPSNLLLFGRRRDARQTRHGQGA